MAEAPAMIFIIVKEWEEETSRTKDGILQLTSIQKIVSVWGSLEAALQEQQRIIDEIGEENYDASDEEYVVCIYEVGK